MGIEVYRSAGTRLTMLVRTEAIAMTINDSTNISEFYSYDDLTSKQIWALSLQNQIDLHYKLSAGCLYRNKKTHKELAHA
ncbi:hypothetical protein FOA32_001479 [Streptococcus sinensis]|nr:hypothetical protein [Streptococcus sinensis]